MYCPNCKQEFDGKFCPECGTKLIEKTQRICPNCNIEVESKFCPECGTKTVEVVEKMVKMCPNCKIETESKFCPECGAKIVEMAVKTTATGEIAAATSNKKSEKKKSDETANTKKTANAVADVKNDVVTYYNTAMEYHLGINGKKKNDKKAVEWYQKAAEMGLAEAQVQLAKCYMAGCGVKRNLDLTFEWYHKAAEQGNGWAQYALGHLYCHSFNPPNYPEMRKWYKKAEAQGVCQLPGLPEPLSPEAIAKAAELQAVGTKVSVEKKSKATANKAEDAETCYLKAAEQENEEAKEYFKKSLTNMDNKEKFCGIFEQYGSMVISSCFGESTFKGWLEGEVFEETGCMLYQVHDMTLERFNTIAELFITHTDINVNDRQKLALMVLLYVVLWDNVGYSNLKIEYNGEVLIDKPENEVFEEYKSYLEKIAEYVPAYEPEDSDDEDWNDEDCDDEWNDDEDIEDYEVKDGVGFIPAGTTEIEDEAFKGREDLISINIPKGVTRIGESAFEDCINLASITIPDSVTEIDDNAINGCTSLENITFPDSLKCISSGLLYCCKNLKNITIPNSITSIGEAAFGECTSLASIKIPNSVTRIEKAAFAECTSLGSIEIPNGVTTIGDCIFHSCTSLKSITLPDSVRSIGEGMCYLCKNVKSIKVPAGKGNYFKELLDDEELAKLVVEIR